VSYVFRNQAGERHSEGKRQQKGERPVERRQPRRKIPHRFRSSKHHEHPKASSRRAYSKRGVAGPANNFTALDGVRCCEDAGTSCIGGPPNCRRTVFADPVPMWSMRWPLWRWRCLPSILALQLLAPHIRRLRSWASICRCAHAARKEGRKGPVFPRHRDGLQRSAGRHRDAGY
jgi:hypothetical protein